MEDDRANNKEFVHDKPIFTFAGFSSPNTTSVPDEAFDIVMPAVTASQWKVVCYIIRRTYGFKKPADTISLKQICIGITTRDGRVLDRGTGLSKSTVIEALYGHKDRKTKQITIPGLIALGIVVMHANTSHLGDADANTYALRMKGEEPTQLDRHDEQGSEQQENRGGAAEEQPTTATGELEHPTGLPERTPESAGGRPSNTPPLSAEQPTVVRRTDDIQPDSLQPDRFTHPDRPDREKLGREGKNEAHSQPASLTEPAPVPRVAQGETAPERGGGFTMAALTINPKVKAMVEEGLLMPATQAPPPSPRKGRKRAVRGSEATKRGRVHSPTPQPSTDPPAGSQRATGAHGHNGQAQSTLASARVVETVTRFAREFGDPKVNACISQANRIQTRSGLGEQAFVDWLYTAASEVHERQRDRTQDPLRKPMAYFFQVLKRHLGLPLTRR